MIDGDELLPEADDDDQADECPCPTSSGSNEPGHYSGMLRWVCGDCGEEGPYRGGRRCRGDYDD